MNLCTKAFLICANSLEPEKVTLNKNFKAKFD